MKHDPEVKIFYSDRYFYISQEISQSVFLLTSLMEQDILLRYIAYIPHFGCTILENTLWGCWFY